MIKSNRGYSLIEIGVGVLILTVFLVFSVGMINGCYTTYRRIKARDLAINRAIYHIETMLQTDSDELTGFFIRSSDTSREPNPVFEEFVHNNLGKFKDRYAGFKKISEDAVEIPDVGSDDLREYIENDRRYLINEYIKSDLKRTSHDNLINGNYGFLSEDGRVDEIEIVLKNEMAFDSTDATNYIVSNNGAVKVVKKVHRIPADISDEVAYGNEVLVIRVDVYYTHEFKRNAKEEDMEVISIETVKAVK